MVNSHPIVHFYYSIRIIVIVIIQLILFKTNFEIVPLIVFYFDLFIMTEILWLLIQGWLSSYKFKIKFIYSKFRPTRKTSLN